MGVTKQKCTTCDRSLAVATFPKHPQGSRCNHRRETCRRCWHQWLQSQVEHKQWDQITCAQCNNVLGQSEVKARATPPTFQK